MIAFNKTLLHNSFLVDEATNLKNSGFLSSENFSLIKKENPPLKSNKNILLRFGFFLLGSFLFGSIMSLLAFFTFTTSSNSNSSSIILFALYSIIGMFICEFLSKEYLGYGIDDAFILGTIGSICGFVVNLITNFMKMDENYYSSFNQYQIFIFITIAITSLMACLRYCHWISGLISLIGITGTFYTLISPYNIGLKLMPFLMMFLAVGLYFLYLKLSEINKIYHYSNSLVVLKSFS